MSGVYYECYTPGEIEELPCADFAQFFTAKKYELLYQEELPRFLTRPLNIYALPYAAQPNKIYRGLDRAGLGLSEPFKAVLSKKQQSMAKRISKNRLLVEALMRAETDALNYLDLFQRRGQYELLWLRSSGSAEQIPDGYVFLGYDITYVPDSQGAFSIINDCMFICRWHGCDPEGTLFAEDFQRLNENGLFST